MVDGVELDIRDVENQRRAFGKVGLARARISHHRHPIHGSIIADGRSVTNRRE
jgi:hypothetical protein